MATEARLDYRLLGPLEVWVGAEQRTPTQAKQRALLALLLLQLDQPISTDQLIERLWPEKAPGRPHTAIQGYVSGLRKLLGPTGIATTAAGYVLRAEPRLSRMWPCRSARQRGAQHRHGQGGTRALTEAHAEIEQRCELELAEQHPMRGLGRDMRRQGMIERIAAQLRQRRDRRSADEAVEQRRDPALARRRSSPMMAASSRPPSAATMSSGSERRPACRASRGRSPTAFVPGQRRRRPCRGRPNARRRRRTAPRRPPRPPWSFPIPISPRQTRSVPAATIW